MTFINKILKLFGLRLEPLVKHVVFNTKASNRVNNHSSIRERMLKAFSSPCKEFLIVMDESVKEAVIKAKTKPKKLEVTDYTLGYDAGQEQRLILKERNQKNQDVRRDRAIAILEGRMFNTQGK